MPRRPYTEVRYFVILTARTPAESGPCMLRLDHELAFGNTRHGA
uniref:Uncharacterized protein n=1 Tax=Anguilla anguilla TaxID=7936 RepID=A0A0E9UDG8_ANGAN